MNNNVHNAKVATGAALIFWWYLKFLSDSNNCFSLI